MDCKVGEIILYTQRKVVIWKKKNKKNYNVFFPFVFWGGAYYNEPAWSLGLAKHLRSVNSTAMCKMTQDYYGGGVSYTSIASLFLKREKFWKILREESVG
jgi:hypothetical protein